MMAEISNLYDQEEMLQLSGIQHYMFCPRQWALIYVEQLWEDNILTTEGSLLHENVDNPHNRDKNGSSIITLRGIRLESKILGFSGIADAVEIHPSNDAPLRKCDLLKSKKYSIVPVEYKRGKRKISDCDRIQVAAQAMSLEEMLDVKITQGAVFYWSERHREYFEIYDALRNKVIDASYHMHKMIRDHITPKVKEHKGCKNCSLFDVCLPNISFSKVSNYLSNYLLNEKVT